MKKLLIFMVFAISLSTSRVNAEEWFSSICETREACIIKAEDGDTNAQFAAGFSYYNRGLYKPDGPKQALKWWKLAAENGHGGALYGLSWLYSQGEGVEKNESISEKYRKSAARNGHSRAQFELGQSYKHSDDRSKRIEAYAWFDLSEKKIHNNNLFRDSVSEKLSSDELVEARKLRDEYYSSYVEPFENAEFPTNIDILSGKILGARYQK